MSAGARPGVHQLLAALSPGDAVGNQALDIQAHLRKAGFESEIFADKAHPRVAARARPLWEYLQVSSPANVCLLHFAIGSAVTRLFCSVPDRRVAVYHNITPPEWFLGWSRELVSLCHLGRRELRALAERTELALAVSEFNRRDLERAGFRNTAVLPLVPDLAAPARPASAVLRRLLADDRDNILFVGRIAPNKRVEDLIGVFAAYQRFVRPASRLLVVGDYRGQERYHGELLRLVEAMRLDEVLFTGHLEDDELRACYAAAHVFLCLSEHEGVGVPLLEAMAFGVPVIAYDAAAIRETLRGGGILLAEKRPELLAELIDLVVHDARLRAAVLETQARTLRDVRGIDFGALLLERLAPVLGRTA